MKSDRLLSLLLLLQSRGRVSERELAETLEVSQRTVHRDLESLSAARVPVVALRGSQGGWELEKGWRAQVPALDERELRALVMMQPRTASNSRLAAAAQTALDKVMASLPAPARRQAAVMRERLHIDPDGWWESGEDLSAIPILQDAVANDRVIAFDYVRADGQAGRRVADPLGLVAKGANWYLVARTSHGMRSFRIARMQNLTVLAKQFKRPPRFNLAQHWKNSVAELEAKRKEFRVRMEVKQAAAQRLALWSKSRRLDEPSEPGWVMLEILFDHPHQAAFVSRGLGQNARVIAPQQFRRELEDEIRRRANALSPP
jgi:predicted DNA-binding transcriptional regulator YafY